MLFFQSAVRSNFMRKRPVHSCIFRRIAQLMKSHLVLFATILMIVTGSCKKVYTAPVENHNTPFPSRTVRFELYTDKDFSGNQEVIRFSLHMKNDRKVLFDSLFATMKVEDIPDSSHRMMIEKNVPGNDTSTLTVGFYYEIEGVGNSWYLDSFPATDTFKLVRYPFQ
jgi:hypothetical protein